MKNLARQSPPLGRWAAARRGPSGPHPASRRCRYRPGRPSLYRGLACRGLLALSYIHGARSDSARFDRNQQLSDEPGVATMGAAAQKARWAGAHWPYPWPLKP